ncbi:MAG: hypothetical protein WCC01_10525 [Acidimicrobiia bacterium]
MGNRNGIQLEQLGVNPDAIGSWVEVKVGDLGVQTEVRLQSPDGSVGPWTKVDANQFVIVEPDTEDPIVWTPTGS